MKGKKRNRKKKDLFLNVSELEQGIHAYEEKSVRCWSVILNLPLGLIIYDKYICRV